MDRRTSGQAGPADYQKICKIDESREFWLIYQVHVCVSCDLIVDSRFAISLLVRLALAKETL